MSVSDISVLPASYVSFNYSLSEPKATEDILKDRQKMVEKLCVFKILWVFQSESRCVKNMKMHFILLLSEQKSQQTVNINMHEKSN